MHLTNWRDFLKFLRPIASPHSKLKKARRALRTSPPAIETLELRVLPTNTSVASIVAAIPPQGTETNATNVTYAVTFDRDVVGVDASDFRIVSNGSVKFGSTIGVTRINDATYSVRINGLSGTGDLRLDLIDDDSIVDENLGGNPLPPNEVPLGGIGPDNGSFQGSAYHLLPAFPQVVSINRNIPSDDTSYETTISFEVTFSKPVVGVDASDFLPALIGGLTITDPIDVTGSGTTYTVTLSGLTGDGTVQLNLVDDNSIRDLAGNPLANVFHNIAVAPVQTVDTGSTANAVATGDLNSDGLVDIVSIDSTAGVLAVELGNGDGTFQTPKTTFITPLGTFPRSLAVRDMDGDGKPDVVIIGKNSNTVSIYAGNGNGSFQSPLNFSTGTGPFAVAVDNLDINGKPDIVFSNEIDNTVGVLKNNDLGYDPDADLSGVQAPAGLAIGDVNRDGFLDLAVTNKNSNSVSVFLSANGDGFNPPTSFNVGATPVAVVAADLNGDGNLDLITANKGSDDLTVLLGNGDGTFQFPSHSYDVGQAPTGLAVTDFDGDGVLDVIVNDESDGSLAFLLGDGAGAFLSTAGFLPTVNLLSGVVIADVDRDGRPDILAAHSDGTGVLLAKNTTRGDFSGDSYVRFNDLPVFASPDAANVPENLFTSTVVLQVQATDASSPPQTLTYSLFGPDAGLFDIDSATGKITFKQSPDYEAPLDQNGNNIYEINSRAADGFGGVSMQELTITVLPVNDNLPLFISPNAATVPETAPLGSQVMNVVATDADLPAQSLTYSLSSTLSIDASFFSINAATGQITVANTLDADSPGDLNHDNIYDVVVTADDGNGGIKTQNIAITVGAVNDNKPIINTANAASVPENSLPSFLILDVNATDADVPVQAITYSLSGDDAALFSINASTGQIRFLSSPDFEAPADLDHNNDYQISVTPNDGFSDGEPQNITISVLPVNDNTPVIGSSNAANVFENTSANTVVLDVNATDADLPAQTLTYSLSGGDAGLFSINAGTGEIRFLSSPDFEAPLDQNGDNLYQFIVTVSDGLGRLQTQNVTLAVQPLNENLPVITSSPTASINENSPASTVILDVNASDADLPPQTLSYSLTGPDAALFSIDSSTGEIRFLASPDFEAPTDLDLNNVYQLSVLVSDGNGGSQSQAISVTVLPANDNRPAFDPPIAVNFAENTPASAIVLAASATDADLPAQTLIYSLSGADAAWFSLSNLGELRFLSSPDFEAPADQNGDNLYEITITVTDSGTPNLATSKNVTITVTDANEPPQAIDSVLLTHANTAINGQLSGSDPDAGASLNFSILTLPLHGILNLIDPLTGAYTYTPDANYIGSDSFTFQVDDGSFDSPGATALITVNSTNSPPVAADATLSIPENLPNGTVVGMVTATDPDVIPGPATDVLTYGITSGNLDGAFSIDPSNGELRVANSSVLNYEALQQIVLQVTVTDIAGESSVAMITVNVTNVNEPLIITLPDSPPVYRKNGPPETIDPEASVYDEDLTSTDYRGGLLVVTVTSSGTPDENDRLGILVEGTGDGKISLVSQYIVYGSPLNIIGTIASGLDGGPLVINLTSFANQESIGALLQAITFYNTSGKPQSGTRTIHFNLTDGPAENSGTKTKLVEFITDSDPPVVTLPSGVLNLTRRSPATALDASAIVTDADSPSLNGGRLTVGIIEGTNPNDRLRILKTGGIKVSGKDVLFNGHKIGRLTMSQNAITVDFTTSSATPAAAQALLRAIAFSTTRSSSAIGIREYQVTLSDGGGGQQTATKVVSVADQVVNPSAHRKH